MTLRAQPEESIMAPLNDTRVVGVCDGEGQGGRREGGLLELQGPHVPRVGSPAAVVHEQVRSKCLSCGQSAPWC
jgi:hypothetical protein